MLCDGSRLEKAKILFDVYDEENTQEIGPDGLDEMFENISDVCLLEIPKLATQLTHQDKEEIKKLMRSRSLAKEALMKYVFPKKSHG